jgi:hypothetical protein
LCVTSTAKDAPQRPRCGRYRQARPSRDSSFAHPYTNTKQGAIPVRRVSPISRVRSDEESFITQRLAGLGESITVVEGDLDHPDSVVKAFEDARHEGGIWGVFAVLAFPGLGAEGDGEERQGKVS